MALALNDMLEELEELFSGAAGFAASVREAVDANGATARQMRPVAAIAKAIHTPHANRPL